MRLVNSVDTNIAPETGHVFYWQPGYGKTNISVRKCNNFEQDEYKEYGESLWVVSYYIPKD